MKVVLSQKAIERLTIIVEYYQRTGYGKFGRKIRARVLAKSMQLKEFPKLGPIEETLKETGQEFRYLIEGNYKIIYLILDDYVLITDIFDTRQNPEKM